MSHTLGWYGKKNAKLILHSSDSEAGLTDQPPLAILHQPKRAKKPAWYQHNPGAYWSGPCPAKTPIMPAATAEGWVSAVRSLMSLLCHQMITGLILSGLIKLLLGRVQCKMARPHRSTWPIKHLLHHLHTLPAT